MGVDKMFKMFKILLILIFIISLSILSVAIMQNQILFFFWLAVIFLIIIKESLDNNQ